MQASWRPWTGFNAFCRNSYSPKKTPELTKTFREESRSIHITVYLYSAGFDSDVCCDIQSAEYSATSGQIKLERFFSLYLIWRTSDWEQLNYVSESTQWWRKLSVFAVVHDGISVMHSIKPLSEYAPFVADVLYQYLIFLTLSNYRHHLWFPIIIEDRY